MLELISHQVSVVLVFGEASTLCDGPFAATSAVKSWQTADMTWPYVTSWNLTASTAMLVTWKRSVDGKFYFLDTRSAWVGGGDFGITEKEVRCSFVVKIKMYGSTSNAGLLLSLERSGSNSRNLVAHRPYYRPDVSLQNLASDEDDDVQFDSKQRLFLTDLLRRCPS